MDNIAGIKIKLLRVAAGLSQRELAEMAGYSQEYISLLECNKRTASAMVEEKICIALAVPVEKFRVADQIFLG